MRYLAMLMTLPLNFYLTDAASAETPVNVRVSLALAQARKPLRTSACRCGSSCPCIAGECGSPGCPTSTVKAVQAPGPLEWAVYLIQYNKAVREKKPLLVWLGETCPACEEQWTEYVHARLSEYDGPKGAETGPLCMIARPDDLGGLEVIGRLDGIPSKSAVNSLLTARSAPMTMRPNYYDQPQPMMMPMMPMMPMMGGFGGGGGCAGG